MSDFRCGEAALDDWLVRQARANQAAGASRTYVACEACRVVGYYAISAGSIAAYEAAGRFRRNMPDPIPIAVLGRLAIDRGFQGRGIGRALIFDCVSRVAQAADVLGIRGVVVYAASEQAKAFSSHGL